MRAISVYSRFVPVLAAQVENMSTITFSLRADLSKDGQDRALAAVAALPEVERVGRVAPDVDEAFAQRMCYAEVADDQAAKICGKLVEMPGVEFASEPAMRFAM